MWVVVILVLFFVASLLRTALRRADLPCSLPWIGKTSNGPFSECLANLKSYSNFRTWSAESYAKYSQNGRSYIFPNVSGRPKIILPNSKAKWLADITDDVASPAAAHYEMLEGEYAFTSPFLLTSMFHEHILHRNLARHLTGLAPGTWAELSRTFDEKWGSDTVQWKTICVVPNMMHTVARASNRIFVGVPLCRDETYLQHMCNFAQDVTICITLMSFVPRLLRPLIGPLASVPTKLRWSKAKKYTLPVIRKRLEDIQRKKREPDWKWEAPDDYITWHIETAMAEEKAKEMEPEMISRFLLPINFAAIHTSTFTISTTLFNLLSSDPKERYIEQLREEAERVLAEHDGVWTKQALNQMVKTDSAIRESLRLSNFATDGITRKVTAKDGLYNEDEGWTAPHGSYIAVDLYNMQHDPEIYDDPFAYKAFRFSDMREEYERKPAEERTEQLTLKMLQLGLVTTGETFLSFGHGKHAWQVESYDLQGYTANQQSSPGRFFINQELKMLIAYILINYDIQHLPERPKDKWLGTFVIPDPTATIQIRRRPGTIRT
ncbi:MAG: hypothetical protein M1821_008285 [Bathelium mastoideum]|nr:MAG: hypothetical protein M1821_008285 [Bathelium mastoideum]KAI9693325.1 MAG: hypothetical protein M1822_005321 [Bathelium mastoideum]